MIYARTTFSEIIPDSIRTLLLFTVLQLTLLQIGLICLSSCFEFIFCFELYHFYTTVNRNNDTNIQIINKC